MASQEELVVIDDNGDWPNMGPQNPKEAKPQDRINKIFDDFTVLLKEDRKDALPITIRTLKQVISRHWPSVANADPDLMV